VGHHSPQRRRPRGAVGKQIASEHATGSRMQEPARPAIRRSAARRPLAIVPDAADPLQRQRCSRDINVTCGCQSAASPTDERHAGNAAAAAIISGDESMHLDYGKRPRGDRRRSDCRPTTHVDHVPAAPRPHREVKARNARSSFVAETADKPGVTISPDSSVAQH